MKPQISGERPRRVDLGGNMDPYHRLPPRGHVLGVVAAAAAQPSGSLPAAASLNSSVRVFDVDSNASVASLDAPLRGLGLAVRPQVGRAAIRAAEKTAADGAFGADAAGY